MSLAYQFYRPGEYKIPYLPLSNGEQPMLAFHGYAQSANDFQYFNNVLNGAYEAIGVNHFFHEHAVYPSERKHQQPLSVKEIGELYMNIPAIKNADKVLGNRTRVKIVKNKVAPQFQQAEFDIMYGKGISKIGEIIDLGVEYNIINKSGSWYSYADAKLGQGRDAVKDILNDNPELLEELEEKIINALT